MSTGNPENDPESRARIAALREGLEKLGWTEGHNIELDYRWARGDPDRVQMLAKELVVLRPDVIVAVTTTAGVALKRETTTGTGRVREGGRSDRQWPCRQPGAAGRQFHRIHPFRAEHGRQMVGAAQGDCAVGCTGRRPLQP